MENEKEIKTDLVKLLGKTKHAQLIKSSATWATFDQDAKSNRSKFYVIGKGLDIIYSDLKDKGVKRDEIARILEEYFPAMTTQNRSDFRKMALNQEEIETYCLEHYAKGFSPSNILYNWTRFKVDVEKKKEADSNPKSDTGSNDDTTGKRTIVTDDGLKVQPHKLKTGLEVENSKVTVEDMKDISKYFFNNIENLYNADKFFSNDDNMDILCYIHIRASKLVQLIGDSVRAEIKKAA